MKSRRLACLSLIFAAGLAAPAPLLAAAASPYDPDIAGSRDVRDLPRFANARIRAYQSRDNAEIIVPVAALNTRSDEAANIIKLQGAITHSDYVIRPLVPAADVDRHYENLLRNAGYETVFRCAGISACGSRMGSLILNDGNVAPAGFADGVFNDQMRVRVARKGATWVLLHVIQGPDRALVYQAVIEGARELE
ncbi:DUF4892 domain-containing protein [Brevundimonas sp.]|uniref:DUF4892 domain-containing protein n=1 Tax=Brevundimonas sp. TaxID=1871086 RepID=UPI002FCBCF35